MVTCAILHLAALTAACSCFMLCTGGGGATHVRQPTRSHTYSTGERSGEVTGQESICIPFTLLRVLRATWDRALCDWNNEQKVACTRSRTTGKTTWLTNHFTDKLPAMSRRAAHSPKKMPLQTIMSDKRAVWHSMILVAKGLYVQLQEDVVYEWQPQRFCVCITSKKTVFLTVTSLYLPVKSA